MAKRDSGPTKIRVSLDLTDVAHQRLAALEQMTHAETKAGVIRNALQIYEYVAMKSAQGCKFVCVNPDGKEESLLFFSPFAPVIDTTSDQRIPIALSS